MYDQSTSMQRGRHSGLARLAWLTMFAWVGAATASYADNEAFSSGMTHFQAGRWALAQMEFEAFLAEAPESSAAADAALYIAQCRAQQGERDQAVADLTRWLEQYATHPRAAEARFRRGEIHHQQRRRAEARADLEAFLAATPRDPFVPYAETYLAEIALSEGKLEEAARRYHAALPRCDSASLQAACRFGLAMIDERHGKRTEAMERYRTVVANSPMASSSDAWYAQESRLRLAGLLVEEGAWDEAERQLEELASDPQRAMHAAYWRGRICSARRDPAGAAAIYRDAVDQNPEHPLAPRLALGAGRAWRQAGESAQAASYLAQAARRYATSAWSDDCLAEAIHAWLDVGELGEAEANLVAFFRAYPESRHATELIERVMQEQIEGGEFAAAASLFERIPSTVTPSARIRYFRALAELGQDHFDEAYRRLESLTSDEERELGAAVDAARSRALAALQRYDEAAASARRYLEVHANGAESDACRARLVESLAELGRFDEAGRELNQWRAVDAARRLWFAAALRLADRLFDAEQWNDARHWYERVAATAGDDVAPRAQWGLGWTYVRLGQFDKGADAFALCAARGYSDQANALWMQGWCLEKCGRTLPAIEAYERLVTAFPSEPPAARAMFQLARRRIELGEHEEAAEWLERYTRQYADAPQQDAALYLWGWALVDAQRIGDSDAVFARLCQEHPESPYWCDAAYRLAERAAQTQNSAEARRWAMQILEHPAADDVRAHAVYLLLQLSATQADWPNARKYGEQFLREFPEHALRDAARYWLAESYYQTHDYPRAVEHFTRVAASARGEHGWIENAHLRVAQALAHQNEWSAAREAALRVTAQFPNSPRRHEAEYLLGRCALALARFAEAREAFQQVVSAPEARQSEIAVMAQWMIGETYMHQGNFDEAIRAYYRAERHRDYPQWRAASLLQIGKCREGQQAWEEAGAVYQELVTTYPDSQFASQAHERLEALTPHLSSPSARPAPAAVRSTRRAHATNLPALR